MKARNLAIFISLVYGSAVSGFGQVNCLVSNKLVCEVPTTATTVAAAAIGAQNAQNNSTIQSLSAAVNSSIGTQLTQLPVPSASVGTVSLQASGNPFGVPFDNLGPILTDRPDTVGKHRIFAGFSYQHFNFNAINGIHLSALPVGYAISQPSQADPTDTQTIYGSEVGNVSFHLDQYVGVVTYGLTRTTDVSVIVPTSDVTLDVSTSNFQTYLYDSKSGQYSNESQPNKVIPTSGSASGIGDVTLRVKQMLLGQEGRRPAVAVGGDVRFPSGDALNYLGSGAWGFNLNGLFEYRWKVSPHAKIGYQWNSNSQLVNIFQSPNSQLPGGVQYAAGADYRVLRQLTLAADVLGSQFVNSKVLQPQALNLLPAPPTGIAPMSLPSVIAQTNTYTTANFSVGAKWHPTHHFLFYGNVLIPINNVGLRSDPVPLAGMAFIP